LAAHCRTEGSGSERRETVIRRTLVTLLVAALAGPWSHAAGAGQEDSVEVQAAREKNIRTWGQLGLTGEWADKPIHVYGYNLQFHFPQEIESRAFGGVSGKWNENLVEYDNQLQPDGSFKLAGQLMLEDLAKDPYGIAYCAGGNAWLTPQIKAVALSIKDGGPYYELTLDNVRNRTYPMYADVFFYIDRDPNKPVDPKVKEFLRYVLSSEGQAQVMRDGKYLPLTAEVVRAQLQRLQ
jgi:phosphate transport system substrate-binding protein